MIGAVARSAGTESTKGYASALDGLWGGLAATLARLERIAAEPGDLGGDAALDELPRLQYALHAASEEAAGIRPPEGAESEHMELAAALAGARDATAEVLEALDAGGAPAARPLVYEWRGALFRVRLARLHLARRPAGGRSPAPVEDASGLAYPQLAWAALLVAGFFVLALGVALDLWPVAAAGGVLVAAPIAAGRR
jgi:hypothetical protein